LKKSIIELLEIKEIELELVKVKGHSDNKWNTRVDKIAKEGSSIENRDRIIVMPPPSSNVSLCWKETIVEGPTRQFVKDILDFKVGSEWRFTSTVQKLEPNEEKEEHDWSLLWKKVRSHSGVRCTSMKKNREIATLIKCVNEKLPVLKTLAKRCPNIYKVPYCVLCNEDQEEDQEHLAICKGHENGWVITENLAINLAWTALSEETQKKTSKLELMKILWGNSIEEKKECRSKSIKGLVQEETKITIQNLTQTLKEAKEFITIWINAAWNGFFENIWKKRCEAVIDWEKANGISSADKKRKVNNPRSDTIRNVKKLVDNRVLEKNQGCVKKEKKKEEEEKIQSSWFGSVRDYIGKKIRPFFYGSNG
jgi:hypothetical protein